MLFTEGPWGPSFSFTIVLGAISYNSRELLKTQNRNENEEDGNRGKTASIPIRLRKIGFCCIMNKSYIYDG